MTDAWSSPGWHEGGWREGIQHGDEIYGAPPLRGCLCVICRYAREKNVYCQNCKNLGPECWYCGRGVWDAGQNGWGEYTDDVASGA